MRNSLVVVGMVLFIVGLLLYYIPFQQFKNSSVDNHLYKPYVNISKMLAMGSTILGFAIFVLGVIIPSPGEAGKKKKKSLRTIMVAMRIMMLEYEWAEQEKQETEKKMI